MRATRVKVLAAPCFAMTLWTACTQDGSIVQTDEAERETVLELDLGRVRLGQEACARFEIPNGRATEAVYVLHIGCGSCQGSMRIEGHVAGDVIRVPAESSKELIMLIKSGSTEQVRAQALLRADHGPDFLLSALITGVSNLVSDHEAIHLGDDLEVGAVVPFEASFRRRDGKPLTSSGLVSDAGVTSFVSEQADGSVLLHGHYHVEADGAFSKSVQCDLGYETCELVLTGSVPRPLSADPGSVLLGAVRQGDTIEKIITLRATESRVTVSDVSVSNTGDTGCSFEAHVEQRAEHRFEARLVVRPSSSGMIRGLLTFQAQSASQEFMLRVPIVGFSWEGN